MADIFISYAREDRETVAKLAAALEGAGYSVWWDRHIVGGAEFSADIEREIAAARAVIVAWSAHGNASHWVKDEAAMARDAGKLVPLSLDGCEPPIGYRQFHALPFAGWKGEAGAEAIAALKQSVAQKTDAAGGVRSSAARSPAIQKPPTVWQIPAARLSLVAAIGITALAAVVLVIWRPWEMSRPGQVIVPEQASTQSSLMPGKTEAPTEKSIAVLPFVDMSEKRDQEYFTDGLSEELIDLIAKVPELRVTARTSSFYFKGKQATIAEIAKALNVAHVLEGSVRKSGNRLRITAQLIRASDSSHLWSETYDRKLDDIFRVQDEIADAVVKELKISLLGAGSGFQGGSSSMIRLRDAPTSNTEAYTLYLQGRALVARYTPADVEKGKVYLRQAVELDPDFAAAWAWLAQARNQAFSLFATENNYEIYRREMVEAVDRALALDPQLPQAHSLKAFISWFMDQDIPAAKREMKRALELGPGDSGVLTSVSLMTLGLGRIEEAEEIAKEAVAQDPLAIDGYRALGLAQQYGGKLTEAEATFRRVLEINPNADGLHARLGLVLVAAGKPEAALAEILREPSQGRRRTSLALAYDALGRRADADKALGDPEKLAADGWYFQIAVVYAHRGEQDQALAWLERGYKNHDGGVYNYLTVDPLLEPLRADPRYQALAKQMSTPR